METNLTIKKIHSVYSGEFSVARIDPCACRHSDAFGYYVSGRADYVHKDGNVLHVRPGTVFYLAKGSEYKIEVFEKCHWICIDFDFLTHDCNRKSRAFDGIPPSEKNDFIKALHVYLRNDPLSNPQLLSIAYNIYYQCIKADHKAYSRSSRLFEQMTSFIIEKYSEPSLSLPEISAGVGISERHARLIFKKMMGCTPTSYLNSIRLEQARNMLRNSNMSVAQIAHSTGFNDGFYFSRVFKKSFGVSPSAYRSKMIDE